MDGPIASAVVLPEELTVPASPPHSLKRRQSSVSEDNAKRLRHNEEDDSHSLRDTKNGAKPAAPARREKGRERRLFGAVLGALSQNPTTAAQKRRSEIEQRQIARRKLEDAESEQRKSERVSKRRAQRVKEQELFEMQTMRVRHENLLHMAHFLQTETEPRLFYKPWETSPEEEERISNQISEARETIEREIEVHKAQYSQDAQRDQHAPVHRDTDPSHHGKNYNSNASQKPSSSSRTNDSAAQPEDLEMKDRHVDDLDTEAMNNDHIGHDGEDSARQDHQTPTGQPSSEIADENGEDVVEEAAEDTVIY